MRWDLEHNAGPQETNGSTAMSAPKSVYIASCQFTTHYPRLSKTVQHYVQDRYGLQIMRCCSMNYKVKEFADGMPDWLRPEWQQLPSYIEVSDGDTIVSICHNCSVIFQEQRPGVRIRTLWELILQDDSFPFPDFSHEKMTLQDCWRSRDNRERSKTPYVRYWPG